jgi:hypothetical protein
MNYWMVVEKISLSELKSYLTANNNDYDKFVEYMVIKFNLVYGRDLASPSDFDRPSTTMILESLKKGLNYYDLSTSIRLYVFHHWMVFHHKTFKVPEINVLRAKLSYHTGETLESVGG